MQVLRVTRKDGHAWTVPIEPDRINIGRDPHNELVLEDDAVSREHCLIEREGHAIVVKDRGTPNGTFINNEFLSEPQQLHEGDRVYIGPFLLELVSLAEDAEHHVQPTAGPHGPVLRQRSMTADERTTDRLRGWAQRWEMGGRLRAELLRGRLLTEAREHVHSGPVDPLVRTFVTASARRATSRRAGIGLGVFAALAVGAGGVWVTKPWKGRKEAPVITAALDEPELEALPLQPKPPAEPAAELTWIEHKVIPAESIDDIARRYGATVSNVARWNELNPDAPEIETGRMLRIHAAKVPLPQQLIAFVLDRDYDWKSLSDRFGVDPGKLRSYNPGIEKLRADQRIAVWINPKPYTRRSETLELPEFEIRAGAISVGAPNQGKLKNGVQIPESPLYIRRYKNIMWGSSHTIETLLKAIARFRQDLTFDHELVLADMSRRNGGKFRPHKSHQAGRDIDIWMPTLKGVYKHKYLGDKVRDRKPKSSEVDWYATWGLVRALMETGEVIKIFLDYPLHEKLHRAAVEMGATQAELAKIQWPRGRGAGGAIVSHSTGHVGHIHVRFKCAPTDQDCRNNSIRGLGDDE
ncbi:MAG: penicillin-insensitive murein endopeptidase [Nannocystaceae bacterium]|nr:penicillin-insensitive murein endopeptidase [Nannocystaceae bacterium]